MENPIKLKQRLEDNASDLRFATQNLSRWIEQKKEKDLAGSESQTMPEVRNLKYNLVEEEKPPKNGDASNNNLTSAKKEKKKVSKFKNKNNAKDQPSLNTDNIKNNENNIINRDKNMNEENIKITPNLNQINAEQCKIKGNRCMQLEKYKEALMNYNYAIELNNSDPAFYSNRALCYLKMENYENCIDDCNFALTIDSNYVKAYYRRMQANECLGNNMVAFEDCSKVLEFEPNNVDAKRSLERIQKRLNVNNNNKTSELKSHVKAQILKNESQNTIEPSFAEKSTKSKLNMQKQTSDTVKFEEYKQNEHSKEESVNADAIPTKTPSSEIESQDIECLKTKSIAYKDQGNDCVKVGDYDKAIMYYTMAIDAYDLNAVFFCNRAFCHLKLKRFNHCIIDCNVAIQLDCNFVKAYFRRMLAYESLNDYAAALLDCNTVLKLEPKNLEAKQCLQRINLKKSLKNQSQPKTILKQISSNRGMNINFIKKPSYQRSIKKAKPIQIQEVAVTIRQLNDNGNVSRILSKTGNSVDAFSPATIEETNISHSEPVINKNDKSIIPLPPANSVVFHNIWKELRYPEQRYLFLKKININDINKLLGPLFDSQLLTELLYVLSVFYVRDNSPVFEILQQIVRHSEFSILKMFMDENDRTAIRKLIDYMNSSQIPFKDITFIADQFQLNLEN